MELIAQRIKRKFDVYTGVIGHDGGKSPEQERLTTELMSDGVAFADRFFRDVITDVDAISKRATSDDEFIENMNDGVATLVGMGCRWFAQMNHALIVADPSGFAKDTHTVEKCRNAIEVGRRLLHHCSGTRMSVDGSRALQDNIRVFTTFESKFHSVTRKKLFGLF